jgi:hypothetical protein
MNHNLFDSLTRVLASPYQPRQRWQALAGTAFATFWSTWSHTPTHANTTAMRPGSGCMLLNHDATCPLGTKKQTKPGNVPTINGCGAEGSNLPIPQGYGKADFTPGCNQHDICYEDCHRPKDACEDEFHNNLNQICAATYPGKLNALFRYGCYERAYVFYQAVSLFGGDAWVAAQQKACECCKSDDKIHCNCNKKCYNSAIECINDCKASLECFTGICAPATEEQCPN